MNMDFAGTASKTEAFVKLTLFAQFADAFTLQFLESRQVPGDLPIGRRRREPGTGRRDPTDGLALKQCIDRLPQIPREVILLTYWEGFSNEEAAEVLNIPQGTVASRKSSAIRRLREMLRPRDGFVRPRCVAAPEPDPGGTLP